MRATHIGIRQLLVGRCCRLWLKKLGIAVIKMIGRLVLSMVVGGAVSISQSAVAASANTDDKPSATLDTEVKVLTHGASSDEPPSEALTIKQIMRYTMTQHLCKKVIKKQASPAEQVRLVELFEALAKCKPPIGSEASWNEKTAALVAAAKDVAAGKPAQQTLMKAANCTSCHNGHRPK